MKSDKVAQVSLEIDSVSGSGSVCQRGVGGEKDHVNGTKGKWDY